MIYFFNIRIILNDLKVGGKTMSNIQISEQQVVSFAGADILAAKTHDGKIYAAVKWVAEGIGLSTDQIKNERKRVQSDLVLSKGGAKFNPPYKWRYARGFVH